MQRCGSKIGKKGELRVQHIMIAVLMVSLFGIFLFSMTTNFIMNQANGSFVNGEDNLTGAGSVNNNSAFYTSISSLANKSQALTAAGEMAPGGNSTVSDTSGGDLQGSFIASGYRFMGSIGNWLFVYPKDIIGVSIGFLGLPYEFANVAYAIMVIIIAIIFVSAIMRNRI